MNARTAAVLRDAGPGLEFEAFARANYPEVLAYLRFRTRNAELAEDLAQETFLQAYRSRRAFDPNRGGPREWVLGIARNVSASAARRRGLGPRVEAILENAWAAPCEREEEDARLSTVRRCVDTLTSRTREVLRLVYEEGLGFAEIAERLGLGVGAAKVAACRGRQAVAACVQRGRP